MRIRTLAVVALLLVFSAGSGMGAQGIVTANPKDVKVLFQNAQVRVMRATIAPHKTLALHETGDAVLVALTSYTVIHKTASGRTIELHRKRGDAVWVPGSERTVEAGAKPVEAILIELKTPAAAK